MPQSPSNSGIMDKHKRGVAADSLGGKHYHEIVYLLYGLTPAEIKIVEDASR